MRNPSIYFDDFQTATSISTYLNINNYIYIYYVYMYVHLSIDLYRKTMEIPIEFNDFPLENLHFADVPHRLHWRWLAPLHLGCELFFFPTTLCGVLVFDSVSRVCSASSRLLRPPPPPHMSHTITSHTHTNLTYNNFTHTNTHTQLCHIPSLTYNTYNNFTQTHTHTHNFVTYHLSHTITSHTQT